MLDLAALARKCWGRQYGRLCASGSQLGYRLHLPVHWASLETSLSQPKIEMPPQDQFERGRVKVYSTAVGTLSLGDMLRVASQRNFFFACWALSLCGVHGTEQGGARRTGQGAQG